jgi:hypothetical protein
VGERKLGLFVRTSRPPRYQSIWMPFAETDISECLSPFRGHGQVSWTSKPRSRAFHHSVGHNSTP